MPRTPSSPRRCRAAAGLGAAGAVRSSAALGVIAGLALVVLAVLTRLWLGAVGFVVMVAAACLRLRRPPEGRARRARSAPRRRGRHRAKGGKAKAKAARSCSGSSSAGSAARRTSGEPTGCVSPDRGSSRRRPRLSPGGGRCAEPAISSMPMLCSTRLRASLVRRPGRCPRSRRAAQLDKEDAEHETDERPHHRHDEEPDDPEQDREHHRRGAHARAAHPAPGTGTEQ